MTVSEVLKKLASLGSPEKITGMKRFGIETSDSFGITAPVLKQFAGEVKKQSPDRHALALGNYFRYDSVVKSPERELAIITAAREKDALYIWSAQVTAGQQSLKVNIRAPLQGWYFIRR